MAENGKSGVRYDDALGYWVSWGHEVALAAFQEPGLSSQYLDAANLTFLPADMHEQCAELIETLRGWFVLLDGPAHTTARRAVQPMFSAARIRRFQDVVEEIVDEALERFASSPEHDAVEELASVVSARTIAHLLGLPGSDDATLRGWAEALADFLAASYRRDNAVRAQRALREMAEFIRTAPDNGEGVWMTAHGSDAERLATSSILLFGGLETTTRLAGFSLWYLLENDLAGSLTEAGAKGVVERVLALYPPIGHVARVAGEDLELGGCPIAKGDLVLVSLTGQDPRSGMETPEHPRAHESTGRVDHVAFGHGMHYCIGAPLARLTAATLLCRFARRFPGASVRSVRWGRNRTYRGFSNLFLNLAE
ncbi:cytochrome P450 [Amycolatopsis sp. YIM 10]|uniref:cytochrome P450 n=1 Tax=Amycolatopsis sp. YIM 10 TaxID=2653857 RepID=UPI0012A87C99|nr:cytochrome P450 [Amycolatopsis sp. YIM 10]QFU88617.1 Cytochrome P450 107B1 [Amycolatopsis sp. YIM 10]